MKDPKRSSSNESNNSSTKLFSLLSSNYPQSEGEDELSSPRSTTNSCTSSPMVSLENSPYASPFNPSPFSKSPWITSSSPEPSIGLIASLTREQGHVYSIAASGDLLYTGSESKNIRVWKNHAEFSGFKSGSGLVKAIVIAGDRIFTGHQDGKIRVWKVSLRDPAVHKRVGSLPSTREFLKRSINPANYGKVRRHRTAVWVRHFDAVSCLSLDQEAGLLYSGSWDKTMKVWRVSDSRCLESVAAHDDAINSVAVAGFDGLVFSGSADGTVKAWRREERRRGRSTRHVMKRVLMTGESAVTAVAVAREAGVVYCGSSDGALNFWGKGKRMEHGGVLRWHKMAVLCVATAGSLVMSGSADWSIGVWRRVGVAGSGVGQHERVTVLRGHMGPIKCMAAVKEESDYDGPSWVVYSGSLDKSVKVWRVAERRGEEEAAHVLMGAATLKDWAVQRY